MSEGKFSQSRPHREEERQIEESFRQLTEEQSRRRKKTYTVEEEIGRSVQEIAAQEIPLSEVEGLPYEKQVSLDPTILADPQPRPVPKNTAASRPVRNPASTSQTARPTKKSPYDLLPEDVDSFFESDRPLPEDPLPEEEPDFIDKLLQFGDFFRKHQTPVILGLCGAAVLLIVLFVSIFFTGGSSDPYENLILPNVLIADVNVGGMTKNEAISAVKQATENTYTKQDMVIDLSGTELRLSPKDTKASLDVKAAVEAAYEYGRTGSQSQQEQIYQNALTEEHVIAVLPYLELDLQYIRGELSTYAEDTGSTLTQTSYGLEGSDPELSADKFNPNAPAQTLVITMGTPGIGFDANDVYGKVLDAYSLHRFLVEVENVQAVSEPDPIDLDAIYKEFYIEPVNASVNLQNFETIPGSYGYGFDLEEAEKLVAKAQYGEVLRIPMEYIAPEVLDNDSFYRDTLGEYQTRGTGNEDRNKNLQLACEAIHNTILNPGESMSFSGLLGKVTGYRVAPEDTGKDAVDRGGVSQVASTLYYAALASDLNVTSRTPHSYMPSFAEYGLDATAELKVLNSTGYPIRIEATYSGGYVKVKILGTEERSYYVMLESSISSTTAAKTVYEDFPYDNAEGYEDGDVIQEGSNGYLVKSYKVRFDRRTGKEQARDFITNSQYQAVDQIVARVEKPVETTPPTEAPTEAPTEPPTEAPTEAPTTAPTEPPTQPTEPSTQPPETTAPSEPPAQEPAVETQPDTASDIVIG